VPRKSQYSKKPQISLDLAYLLRQWDSTKPRCFIDIQLDGRLPNTFSTLWRHRGMGYPSIIGGGDDLPIWGIIFIRQDPLKDGDLVLMDYGHQDLWILYQRLHKIWPVHWPNSRSTESSCIISLSAYKMPLFQIHQTRCQPLMKARQCAARHERISEG